MVESYDDTEDDDTYHFTPLSEDDVKKYQFTPTQIAIIRDLDKKYQSIGYLYEKHYSELSQQQKDHCANAFFKILEFYHIFFNKLITNDDFLFFRINNLLKNDYFEKSMGFRLYFHFSGTKSELPEFPLCYHCDKPDDKGFCTKFKHPVLDDTFGLPNTVGCSGYKTVKGWKHPVK